MLGFVQKMLCDTEIIGLKLKILNLAFPIRLPNKSPSVERIPPRTSKKIINNQPVTSKVLPKYST